MSEHITSVKYKVSIEGADDSIREFQGILTNVSRGISLFSRLDHLTLSWQKAAERLDMRSFLSVALSTVSTLQMIIRLTRSAEAAQLAYNAALAIGRLLEGPRGWLMLGAAATFGAAAIYGLTRPGPAPQAETLSDFERWRREAYRSVVQRSEKREEYRSIVNY